MWYKHEYIADPIISDNMIVAKILFVDLDSEMVRCFWKVAFYLYMTTNVGSSLKNASVVFLH